MTILDLRNEAGMSQAEFAKQFGFNVRTLISWENNVTETPSYVLNMVQDFVKSRQVNSLYVLRNESVPRKRSRGHTDLVGQRFNKLTVVEQAPDYVNPRGQRYIQWKCRCDCGNYCIKRGSSLTSGKAVSCGCARSSSNRGKGLIDLTGQTIGFWTVLYRGDDVIDSRGKHIPMWMCRCKCGTERLVAGSSLRNKNTLSCGCFNSKKLCGDSEDILDCRDRNLVPEYPAKFTGLPGNISKFVKYYQFSEFYKHELSLWNRNDLYKGVLLRDYIFQNRQKYIGKQPSELSDKEILRGFRISGVYRGYTVYDATLFQQVLDEYDIQSVYDPCAGWGERLLMCYSKGIKYHGVDINDALLDGYTRMISDFNMTKQSFEVGDSEVVECEDFYDAVITCPPYWNIEHYTGKGAENLDYDNFLVWWDAVVSNSINYRTKYFCFQINQKFRDDMTRIVENYGFTLVDAKCYKNNKSSHFTRKWGGSNQKTEFEVMLIFENDGYISGGE